MRGIENHSSDIEEHRTRDLMLGMLGGMALGAVMAVYAIRRSGWLEQQFHDYLTGPSVDGGDPYPPQPQ